MSTSFSELMEHRGVVPIPDGMQGRVSCRTCPLTQNLNQKLELSTWDKAFQAGRDDSKSPEVRGFPGNHTLPSLLTSQMENKVQVRVASPLRASTGTGSPTLF